MGYVSPGPKGPTEDSTQCLRFLYDPPPTPTLSLFLQSGGGSVPPMKVVTPGASRLKAAQSQAGSPDKSKHGKQRAEYMRIQAQQQVRRAPWDWDLGPIPAPPPAVLCAPVVCWVSTAIVPMTTFPLAVQRGPRRQDCFTSPLRHLLLPLPNPSALDLV